MTLIKSLLTLTVGITLLASPYGHAEDYGRAIEPDSTVVTEHKTTINGDRVNYTATTGTQPVWNDEGDAVAALHYTYYKRSDVKDDSTRPLVISFNGGPGSASVWMHIAYTGPVILNIDDEGYPLQPYGVKKNPYSILDVADIVYVNPVNTGYSRVLKNEEGELPSKDAQKDMFFGVNADVKYLAEWLNTFVTRNNRWRSPKYLIGESYGTTRVSGLALALFANYTLATQWRSGVDNDSPAVLVKSGLYRVTRNPGYIGVGLGQIGFFIAYPSLFTLVCVLIGMRALYRQILFEEAHLKQRFKETFTHYARHTPRFLPLPSWWSQ